MNTIFPIQSAHPLTLPPDAEGKPIAQAAEAQAPAPDGQESIAWNSIANFVPPGGLHPAAGGAEAETFRLIESAPGAVTNSIGDVLHSVDNPTGEGSGSSAPAPTGAGGGFSGFLHTVSTIMHGGGSPG